MDSHREIAAKFYTQQYKILKFFTLWKSPPNTSESFKIFYKICFWLFFIFWILLFDVIMILQIIHLDSIGEVIKVLLILPTCIAMLGKFLTVKTKSQSFEKLFALYSNQKYLPHNNEEGKLFQKCLQLSTKIRNLYRNLAYLSCCAIYLSEYVSGSGDLPVSVYSPFGLDAKWKYSIMYMYICVCLGVGCMINVAFDTLSSSFFIHLKGQLDLLGYRLENIGRNAVSTQDAILQQLKDCVRFYNRILKLKHDVEYLVSAPLSLQVACSVFVLIANFYALSTISDYGELEKVVKIAVYQACMLSQIFIVCYFANDVSLKSSEIAFNLYSSDWYSWNKINRKLVLLMMLRFKTPIGISSINSCYSFNLPAFSSIVNSSYSYFTLLKRTN